MIDTETIREIIDKNRAKFIERLRTLIKIQSVSKSSEGCEKISNHLLNEIKSLNVRNLGDNVSISVKKINSIDSIHPILISELTAQDISKSSQKSKLLFMSHMDTQPSYSEEWKYDPYGAEIDKNRIYGRGSLDTKGQIAAILSSMEILNELGIKILDKVDIKLFFNSDEEIGSLNHSIPFLRENPDVLKVDAVINGENTNERIVLGCKGMLNIKITAKIEKSLHSGKSVFIENHPVFILSEFLTSIRKDNKIILNELSKLNPEVEVLNEINPYNLLKPQDNTEYKQNKYYLTEKSIKKAFPDFLTFNPNKINEYARSLVGISFNVNTLHSGNPIPSTIVPKDAIAYIDIRIPPNIHPNKILDILETHSKNFPTIDLELINQEKISEYLDYYMGKSTQPDNELVKLVWDCFSEAKYSTSIAPFSTGTSDERLLPLNVPHIKLGAKGSGNHSYDEYIENESYLKIIEIYARIIHNYSKKAIR